MPNLSNDFLVTRQKAAKIIGVSTRTIDRYIAQEKFSIIREDGKVLLDSRELQNYKNGKNPVVAQVVREKSSAQSSSAPQEPTSKSVELSSNFPGNTDSEKYKILYEEIKSEAQQKEDLLRGMHYKLGVLETEAKTLHGTTVPLLESENQKQELETEVQKISAENEKLHEILKSARNGRVFFFILSLVFLILILSIFVLQKGNLFQIS